MNIGANGKTIAAATRELSLRWEETKTFWQDAKSQEFEHKYIVELLAGVDRAVAIFDELDKLISKVRHESVGDDFPGRHITKTRNYSDEDADAEGANKSDLAAANVFPVGTYTEEDQEERQHHRGVADVHPSVESDLFDKGHCANHE